MRLLVIQWMLSGVKSIAFHIKKIVLSDGTIQEGVALIGGMTITEARMYIVECLREKGFLVKQETIQHMVAIHERCGTSVELIPSRQWYIEVLTDKEKYLKAADEINWHPAHMKIDINYGLKI